MNDLRRGRLKVAKGGSLQVSHRSKKGAEVWLPIADSELFAKWRGMSTTERVALAGLEVDYEHDGQARRVRPAGVVWAEAPAPAPREPAAQAAQTPNPRTTRDTAVGHFHNPYNFIPAPPREGAGYPQDDPKGLGDGAPATHGRYLDDHWTGRIRVQMTAETPILLPDTSRVTVGGDGHKTFDIPCAPDRKPRIPATAIKGALRAAYEAVTNSRFGVFSKSHDRRFGYRMAAGEGLRLVPARVDGGDLVLMRGASHVNPRRVNDRWIIPESPSAHRRAVQGQDVEPAWPRGLLHAAWVPGDLVGYGAARPPLPPLPPVPQHGTHVDAFLRCRNQGQYKLWTVDAWVPFGSGRPKKPSPHSNRYHDVSDAPPPDGQWVEGWLCITEDNVKNKHDERLFFTTEVSPPRIPITRQHREMWGDLIANYRSCHDEDVVWRRKNPNVNGGTVAPEARLGGEPGKTAWSRHIFRDGQPRRDNGVAQLDDAKLEDAQLLYVALDASGTVIGLYPVIIARELFDHPPAALLPASLQPATTRDALSPADRVFGWVHPQGHGAHKGQLRLHRVTCESDAADAVERFDPDGVPLAILGQPKPQQGRFYLARDKSGRAQEARLDRRRAGYNDAKKGLRGRKVYPHQHPPAGHWDDPTADRTQDRDAAGWYQEYRRPKKSNNEQRDSQNRSVRAWIKPRARFTFDLDVVNLSDVELGALLWLLDPARCPFHKLGGGKPLGFGSVTLTVDQRGTCLRRGKSWQRDYKTLGTDGTAAEDPSGAITAFEDAVKATSAGVEPSFIAAFRRAAQGFDDRRPTHYPRAGTHQQNGDSYPPSPDGEAFKWFVQNDRNGQRVLPDLVVDQGLPRLYEPPPKY